MGAIQESCSKCGSTFDVTFRYQMEERDGGFVFFCSQRCLKNDQQCGADGPAQVVCGGCAKRFTVSLAVHVLYAAGQRQHACSMACRKQLLAEARGVRLGELNANAAAVPRTAATPVRGASPPAAPRRIAPSSRRSRPPARTPRRIAVFNHKGGTGKTTTSVNLAAGLAARGNKVLLIDTDAQGNVAVSLGAKSERSLYHVLVMGLAVSSALQTLRPRLDLLPSNETLAAAELYLAGRQKRDRVLSRRLLSATEDYDYVVIDCSPSLSLMNQNALVLADSVLVPVACDYLSLVGVRQVLKTVKNVNRLLQHPLQIWGVLPTFYDGRAKICREALDTLKTHFKERCLTPVRATTKLKEAPARARTIFEHSPNAYGAQDYATLVDKLLQDAAASPAAQRVAS